jgi:hypothetical protein
MVPGPFHYILPLMGELYNFLKFPQKSLKGYGHKNVGVYSITNFNFKVPVFH